MCNMLPFHPCVRVGFLFLVLFIANFWFIKHPEEDALIGDTVYASRKIGRVQQRKEPPDLMISVISTSITWKPGTKCLFTFPLTGKLNTRLLPMLNTFVPN